MTHMEPVSRPNKGLCQYVLLATTLAEHDVMIPVEIVIVFR